MTMGARPGGPGGGGTAGGGTPGGGAGSAGSGGAAGPGAPRRPMGGFGGPGGMMRPGMMPAEKAKDFRGSFRRMLGELRPEARRIVVVVALAIVSVLFSVSGPKILGNATNLLFDGVVGK
jgi:ATP-binding cassette, subfamily B, multidrug efflux pump